MTQGKGTTIAYWITTGLLAFALTGSGVMDLMQPAEMVEGMEHLGYPAYVLTLLGIAKLLAVPAILSPRFPVLKEWAYAGVVFDFGGAMFSHLSSGDGMPQVAPLLVLLTLTAASYLLRPASRRVAAAASSDDFGSAQLAA